jgi:hypothetical protein
MRRLLLAALMVALVICQSHDRTGAVPAHKPPAKQAGKANPAKSRAACRKIMKAIAEANQAHMIRTGEHNYTTDVKVLEEETGEKFLGKCPAGGKYTITRNADSTFTVHCSIKAHESNPHGPSGYTPPPN